MVIGKNTPPNKVEAPPNIVLKGMSLLNVIIKEADIIPILEKHKVAKKKIIITANTLTLLNLVATLSVAPTILPPGYIASDENRPLEP